MCFSLKFHFTRQYLFSCIFVLIYQFLWKCEPKKFTLSTAFLEKPILTYHKNCIWMNELTLNLLKTTTNYGGGLALRASDCQYKCYNNPSSIPASSDIQKSDGRANAVAVNLIFKKRPIGIVPLTELSATLSYAQFA